MKSKDVLQLVFIRHAETDYEDWAGRDPSDGELTPEGEAQCDILGQQLKDVDFDALITSSLLRAFKTAAGVGRAKGGKPTLHICPEIIECGCTPGYYGCSQQYLSKIYGNTKMCDNIFGGTEYDFCCEGVPANDLRAQKFIDYLQQKFTYGQRVAIFSHHGMLEYLIPTALGVKTRDFFFALDNISVTVVDICRDGNRVLRCVNKSGF